MYNKEELSTIFFALDEKLRNEINKNTDEKYLAYLKELIKKTELLIELTK